MGFDVQKIRNVAVIAGGGAGKTSLVEAVLFDTKHMRVFYHDEYKKFVLGKGKSAHH